MCGQRGVPGSIGRILGDGCSVLGLMGPWSAEAMSGMRFLGVVWWRCGS